MSFLLTSTRRALDLTSNRSRAKLPGSRAPYFLLAIELGFLEVLLRDRVLICSTANADALLILAELLAVARFLQLRPAATARPTRSMALSGRNRSVM
jgi:hypothetical protein